MVYCLNIFQKIIILKRSYYTILHRQQQQKYTVFYSVVWLNEKKTVVDFYNFVFIKVWFMVREQ